MNKGVFGNMEALVKRVTLSTRLGNLDVSFMDHEHVLLYSSGVEYDGITVIVSAQAYCENGAWKGCNFHITHSGSSRPITGMFAERVAGHVIAEYERVIRQKQHLLKEAWSFANSKKEKQMLAAIKKHEAEIAKLRTEIQNLKNSSYV
jgi:hypothetical protein